VAFFRFDGKRIAVVIRMANRRVPLRGSGKLERVDGASQLRVDIDGEGADACGHPTFLFRADQWSGTIEKDFEFGCDYCIRLDASSPRVASLAGDCC